MENDKKCPRKWCRGVLQLDSEENQLVCTSCARRFDPKSFKEVTDPSITFNDKPGKVQTPTGTGLSSQPEGDSENKNKEGECMLGKVNIEDLHPDTLEKVGAEIPPKPDTSGLNKGQAMQVLGKYYEDNKELIIHDLETLGEKATLKKWGISLSGWRYKKVRLNTYNENKSTDLGSFSFDPVKNAHLEVRLSYFMGYHACVQDFLKAGVIR
jgi:hypothetical protein